MRSRIKLERGKKYVRLGIQKAMQRETNEERIARSEGYGYEGVHFIKLITRSSKIFQNNVEQI